MTSTRTPATSSADRAPQSVVKQPLVERGIPTAVEAVLQLQGEIGNHAVQRLLCGRAASHVQRQPAPASAPPGTAAAPPDQTTPQQIDYDSMSVADLRMEYVVLDYMLRFPIGPLRGLAPALRVELEKLTQALVGKITAEQVSSLLTQFQTISVFVPGTSQPLPAGQVGPPAPKQVTFHAAYYINTDAAKAHVQSARDASQFSKIVKAVNASGSPSTIQSGGKAYGGGSAALVGKSTPDNVRQFTQEALNNGAVRKYALQQGTLPASKQLSDLSDGDAAAVVQSWVLDNGVGVDCSGFVLQAAIKARDEVRKELRALGVPEGKLPKALSHEERNAKSFESGPLVAHPTDLQPGDAWVLNSGKHVKIVTAVRRASNAGGDPVIEIDTAESAGDSTHTAKGPVAGTRQTRSLTVFGLGGSFHRI